MAAPALFHIAIKTNDLDATVRFYEDVVGLVSVFRPDFGYPGAWLGTPGAAPFIHIYAGGPALGEDGRTPYGTAAIDHVSITATGYHAFIAKFREHGLDWREFRVPGMPLWQLFVYDPSGVQLELTFDSTHEDGPDPDLSDGRRYLPGRSFFRVPEHA